MATKFDPKALFKSDASSPEPYKSPRLIKNSQNSKVDSGLGSGSINTSHVTDPNFHPNNTTVRATPGLYVEREVKPNRSFESKSTIFGDLSSLEANIKDFIHQSPKTTQSQSTIGKIPSASPNLKTDLQNLLQQESLPLSGIKNAPNSTLPTRPSINPSQVSKNENKGSKQIKL